MHEPGTDERRMIDAFLRRHGATRVPMGVVTEVTLDQSHRMQGDHAAAARRRAERFKRHAKPHRAPAQPSPAPRPKRRPRPPRPCLVGPQRPQGRPCREPRLGARRLVGLGIGEILDQVAAEFGLEAADIAGASRRDRRTFSARAETVRRAYDESTHSLTEIGRALQRHFSSTLNALRRGRALHAAREAGKQAQKGQTHGRTQGGEGDP